MTTTKPDLSRLISGRTVPPPKSLRTADQISGSLRVSSDEIRSGRYRTLLYRFLTDQLPVVSACIWTWARLATAPGRFRVADQLGDRAAAKINERLEQLLARLYQSEVSLGSGRSDLMVELATGLFRDGLFGGFLTVDRAATGVERFIPVDAAGIGLENVEGRPRLRYETDAGTVALDRPDFYLIPLGGGTNEPLGRSVLKAIPFVAYVEQQLVDDMRRSAHNAGYHRLHVKIAPPERLAGEADKAYLDRINSYFDSTVAMIRSCEVDDNPVTWDNIEIQYIGPENSRSVTNSWFLNHRAMIEEVCAGTNLAPFLLGYSYGATTSWSAFKFDLVMRQVRSVQAEIARFMEWVASVDLALAGIDARVRWEFDNTFAYQANEEASVQTQRVSNVIKLYEAGLIDKKAATDRAACLL